MLVPCSGVASTRNVGDVGDPRERLMGRSRISTNGGVIRRSRYQRRAESRQPTGRPDGLRTIRGAVAC
jgi:hypothetical protein